VNRSIARSEPGNSSAGIALAAAVRTERNPALQLKISSSIWRQSHQQVSPESGFSLRQLRAVVQPVINGSYRNHCPLCLWSKHVDVRPGDRASGCGGMMLPVQLDHRSGKGLVIVHRCTRCAAERVNRLACDTAQPDDIAAIGDLMTQRVPARR
jgi:hypothetical protein